MNDKKKSPCTAATVTGASNNIQDQNSTIQQTCKVRSYGKVYTEAEINDTLLRLEVMRGEKMEPSFRRFFTLLNNLGLFDAFCDVCAETPNEKTPDYEWFVAALDEAKRRVAV